MFRRSHSAVHCKQCSFLLVHSCKLPGCHGHANSHAKQGPRLLVVAKGINSTYRNHNMYSTPNRRSAQPGEKQPLQQRSPAGCMGLLSLATQRIWLYHSQLQPTLKYVQHRKHWWRAGVGPAASCSAWLHWLAVANQASASCVAGLHSLRGQLIRGP